MISSDCRTTSTPDLNFNELDHRLAEEKYISLIYIANIMKKKSYLNTMLEAVKFPASITDLNTGLTDVNADALSHFSKITKSAKKERWAFIKTPFRCFAECVLEKGLILVTIRFI